MTNAERFKQLFGLYATELWSKPEKDFLTWLNMEYVPDTNVGELISIQDAIEEIARRDTTDGTVKVFSGREVIEMLKYLPSTNAQDINAVDTISRQAAIDALESKVRYTDHDEPVVDWNDLVAVLVSLPSVQPRKGKWIDDGTELGCCCSECGTTLDDYFDGSLHKICLSKIPNFCPNCGSYNGWEKTNCGCCMEEGDA